MKTSPHTNMPLYAILGLVLSLLIALGAAFYYTHQKNSIVLEKSNDLRTISSLKAEQIVSWHRERLADASVLIGNPFFEQAIATLRDNKLIQNQQEDFNLYFQLIKKKYAYQDIILADTAGNHILGTIPGEDFLDSTTASQIQYAIQSEKSWFTDVYYCPAHQSLHYDIIVPVTYNDQPEAFVIILRNDPDDFLLPLINAWPIPRQTAENQIVKKAGNDAVFINQPQLGFEPERISRVPLTDTLSPAVKAVRGFTGIVSGVDYRNKKVLTHILPVAETDWFLISKIDQDEIFAELKTRTAFIVITAILLILLAAASLATTYGFRQRGYYKNLLLKQKELDTSESRNKTTLYSIGDGVITTDTKGHIQQINPVAERLTGWTEKEAIGRSIEEVFQIVSENTGEAADNPVSKVLREGNIVGLANHTLLIDKNGKKTPIADSGAPIKTHDGEILGVVLVFRDQTEERAAQVALQQSEERFRSMIEGAPVGIFIQTDWKFAYLNPAFKQLLKVNHETDLVGRPVMNHIHPEYHEIVKERIRRLNEKQLAVKETRQMRFLCADGTEVWVETIAEPFRHKGKNGGLVFVRDISQRIASERELLEKQEAIKAQNEEYQSLNEEYMALNEELKATNENLLVAVEKAQESDRLKTAFLNNLSHEIRTPLNAIIGFSEFLGQPEIDADEQKKFISIIHKNGFQLAGIINDIVNISTIEAGQETLRESVADVHEILEHVYTQFKKSAEAKHIQFTYTSRLGSDERKVYIDETKLTQVLGNLTGNAIKFTDSGSVEILCRIKDNQLYFSVKDTGIGIPEEYHDYVFERFKQVEHKGDKLYGGTGLGLAISKAYVELMDGEIWLESAPGQGTVFHFTIAHRPVKSKKQTAMHQDEQLKSKHQKTILIVEDEFSNYFFLEIMFNKMNITPIVAKNGQEAVDACKNNQDIDLVLMDLKMPVLNGFEATRQIKAMRPDLPIIAQTAYALSSDKHKAMEAGCDDYLTKPVKKEDLLATLARYL